MDIRSLKKKTVAELREEAKKIPDVTGLSGMKKDELVSLIAAHLGVSEHTPAAAPEGKTEIKQRIHKLKEDKRNALAANDQALARACNREIHKYKRMLRRMARTGG